MTEQILGLRSFRITTKQPSSDRFLTTQIHHRPQSEASSPDDTLGFLVEIHNPWFPSAKIGQTIINTVIREYHRAESSSVLTNFEIALRKTNEILSSITQTGETDWIGHLSSLIVVIRGQQIHLAQTGRAHAYLLRKDRCSLLTDDLEAEAQLHPLTTYTNITSGQLEIGDRLLMASSDLAETLSVNQTQTLLKQSDLSDAGRAVLKTITAQRLRRVNALLVEISNNQTETKTIYLDQPMATIWESMTHTLKHTVRPQLLTIGRQVGGQTQRAKHWTRDWLIPQMIKWSKRTQTGLAHQTKRLRETTQPVVHRIRTSLRQRQSQSLHSTNHSETGVKVHRYDQQPTRPSFKKAAWQIAIRTGLHIFWQRLLGIQRWLKQRLRGDQLTPRQRLLLISAGILLLIILISIGRQRTRQVTQEAQVTASAALTEAQALQTQAERAFILGEKESAKNLFLQTLAAAKLARDSQVDQAQVEEIIQNSQTIIDQLTQSTRINDYTLSSTATINEKAIVRLPNQTLVLTPFAATLLPDLEIPAAIPVTISLPSQISTITDCQASANEIICAADQDIIRFDLSARTSLKITKTETWPTLNALERFGNNLYFLENDPDQIWRTTIEASTASERQAWLKQPETDLSQAIDIAIDGDLYLLLANGEIRNYRRGERIADWQISGLPTPRASLAHAERLFTSPTSQYLYVWESASDDNPARIVAFDKQGVFVKQLILPSTPAIDLFDFDADQEQGSILSQGQLGRFSWGISATP